MFKGKKTFFGIPFLTLLLAGVFTPSFAEVDGSATSIGVRAGFLASAYVSIEHETFSIPRVEYFMPVHYQVEKAAKITLSGIPGIPAMVSCNIEAVHGGARRVDGANVRVSDCGGSQVVASRFLSTGESFEEQVVLNSDLLPAWGQVSESSVFIEISYI